MRDKKGRFIHGHKPTASRNPKTGKFIRATMADNKYEQVSKEVDEFFKQLEAKK